MLLLLFSLLLPAKAERLLYYDCQHKGEQSTFVLYFSESDFKSGEPLVRSIDTSSIYFPFVEDYFHYTYLYNEIKAKVGPSAIKGCVAYTNRFLTLNIPIDFRSKRSFPAIAMLAEHQGAIMMVCNRKKDYRFSAIYENHIP